MFARIWFGSAKMTSSLNTTDKFWNGYETLRPMGISTIMMKKLAISRFRGKKCFKMFNSAEMQLPSSVLDPLHH